MIYVIKPVFEEMIKKTYNKENFAKSHNSCIHLFTKSIFHYTKNIRKGSHSGVLKNDKFLSSE